VAREKKYLFGPVASRRLGLSLGIDIVPFKICSQDCIYCELGPTTEKSIERKDYAPIEDILAELKERLAEGLSVDFITITGSGEPTLNSRLGELVEKIKKITKIPVAILTNGTLFYRQDVRADCAKADVVVPSLDAGDEGVFEKINRPHPDINIEKLILGLCSFRDEYHGQIWLEVFLVEGVNTGVEQIAEIKEAIKRIRPDKIQLNTAVRPTAEAGIERVKPERLADIAKELGENCEVVADFSAARRHKKAQSKAEYVLSMLKRRPCSIEDICSGLGISREEAQKYIVQFEQQGVIDSEIKNGIIFFKSR
jgi:wyosine [tRNA(Phe)-imidazoG37] synthetase (radical SAM superfamily)